MINCHNHTPEKHTPKTHRPIFHIQIKNHNEYSVCFCILEEKKATIFFLSLNENQILFIDRMNPIFFSRFIIWIFFFSFLIFPVLIFDIFFPVVWILAPAKNRSINNKQNPKSKSKDSKLYRPFDQQQQLWILWIIFFLSWTFFEQNSKNFHRIFLIIINWILDFLMFISFIFSSFDSKFLNIFVFHCFSWLVGWLVE